MIKIDKNIPIPEGKRKYPFDEMIPGDSFFIEGGDKKLRMSIAASASQWIKGQKNNVKFTTRLLDEGVRCWRIS